ncbi:DUF1329 domain-containing protein [Aestuariirhabdus litorea]|uniref:DUF1329 domain-containing protein n=1 Tax=Aestuariirhabdus litorea TaxID=2528527 RepID=A0A3P3VLR5_9GAMM|nr:DUF1329 domain-containing protein [Aestuariirhabdus litorea]RRJ83277.1 DUF1329 domain-containing protein [Aestuariirhabdus litorea]RWW93436.1 DUF1329 domain-containing protein [Endozoicomonadaceae bacterium GTF-13]
MNMHKKLIGAGAMALTLMSASVMAAVSPEEAARLNKDLTPLGAERAGNADGTIPEWTGGLTKAYAPFDENGSLADPFADEKPLFTITAQNYEQYADKLSEGQKAMFKLYPETYSMPVYPTHRTATVPQEVQEQTFANATSVDTVRGGNGLKNYKHIGSTPFPIPQAGVEAVWNHTVRYRGGSTKRTIIQATPTTSGSFSAVKFQDEFTFSDKVTDFDGNLNNLLFYFKQRVLEPARLAGNVLLVHETIDQVEQPRMAWVYNAGQRRVRRAPQVAYDGPGTASDGLRTSDNFDMYNGAPDRYDWKLVGKKEMYIPYNSYNLYSNEHTYEDIIKAGHIDPQYTRYELHRVWEVVGTLKEGERHIYAKRVMFLDEDSWQASVIDHFDGRGQLWRVAQAYNMHFYPIGTPWYAAETLNDLLAGRYLVLGLQNEEKIGYQFGFEATTKDYTPAALRRSGVR